MIYGFNAGEVFKIAIEIEENGRLFYETAGAETGDPELKGIFAGLAKEEVEHKKRFTALKDELPASTTEGTVWDPENEMDQYLKTMADMHIFSSSEGVEELLAQVKDAKTALNTAIQFEKDSIVFFAEMQSLAENEESRNKIGQLVKEEQGHLKKLALQLRKMK